MWLVVFWQLMEKLFQGFDSFSLPMPLPHWSEVGLGGRGVERKEDGSSFGFPFFLVAEFLWVAADWHKSESISFGSSLWKLSIWKQSRGDFSECSGKLFGLGLQLQSCVCLRNSNGVFSSLHFEISMTVLFWGVDLISDETNGWEMSLSCPSATV